ncbi:MAG: hypothetical protein H6742_17105 [Alphaproteobacteria bacterium]|nr:hypothetical protein [Alphaproteobacteria bacterium]
MTDRVHLVDCTLREGDQSPGVAMSVDEKLAVAALLDRAGVALADAGMPELSTDEQRFLAAAAERSERLVVGASVRCIPASVALARDCGVGAVFVICPTSRLHLDKRLGTDLAGLLDRMAACADRVGDASLEIVCEDASRAEPGDLDTVVDHAARIGAARVYLADTVGCRTPAAFAALTARAVAVADGRLAVGAHCHDDLGMATANTVAAVEAGARWPTACVNGLGERAGNARLEAVALACEVALGLPTGIDSTLLPALSAAVEAASGHLVPSHAPIVGRNAWRHESGIHVDGLLKDPTTYEVVDPVRVGAARRFVLGMHSGRAQLRALLDQRHPGLAPRLQAEGRLDALLDDLRRRVQQDAVAWDRAALAGIRSAYDALLDAQGVPLDRFDRLVAAALSDPPLPDPARAGTDP